jgi:hypothetical protein
MRTPHKRECNPPIAHDGLHVAIPSRFVRGQVQLEVSVRRDPPRARDRPEERDRPERVQARVRQERPDRRGLWAPRVWVDRREPPVRRGLPVRSVREVRPVCPDRLEPQIQPAQRGGRGPLGVRVSTDRLEPRQQQERRETRDPRDGQVQRDPRDGQELAGRRDGRETREPPESLASRGSTVRVQLVRPRARQGPLGDLESPDQQDFWDGRDGRD